jgi:uncharacterized protein (TIGR02246 family)
MKPLRNIGIPTALRLALALAPALTACGGPAPSAAQDIRAIKEVNVAWNKAYNAGDGAAVAALYADDAVLSVPRKPPMRGKEAINAYYLNDAPSFAATEVTVADDAASEVGESGDLAWQWGTYRNTNKAGEVQETGKYLTVFERRGGKWVIVRDIWNSDAPDAPAAAAAAPPAAPAAAQ